MCSHHAVDPVDVVGYFGVDAGSICSCTTVAVARHAVDVPPVRLLQYTKRKNYKYMKENITYL